LFNAKQDLDGKKAVVVLETGDCDAAVDAALTALKTSSFNSCGLYLIVQDSMLEEIDWRLRERFNASRSGELLDKTIDFTADSCYQAPSKVTDYLQGTKLDVSIFVFNFPFQLFVLIRMS
jgi:acyl-CoA reductase-like NAD-dependent aldehyde dehydrogenase